MNAIRRGACRGLLCLLLPLTAAASEWFVVESSSRAYPAAAMLQAGQRIELGNGERLFLYASTGAALTLDGPFAGELQARAPASPGVGFTDGGLIVGATRSATGSHAFDTAKAWPVQGDGDGLTLPIGAVDGVRENALFALRDRQGVERGLARVIGCTLTGCTLRALGDVAGADVHRAELRAMPATLPLGIWCEQPEPCARIESLRATQPASAAWARSSSAGAADIRAGQVAGQWWFRLAGDGDDAVDPARHPVLALPARDDELLATLERISRAVWLLRLAQLGDPREALALLRVAVAGADGTLDPLRAQGAPRTLRTGDVLQVSLDSPGRERRFWVYHIDSQFRVSNFFPEMLGESARVEADADRSFELDLDATGSSGLEHLLAVVIDDGAPRRAAVAHLQWVLQR